MNLELLNQFQKEQEAFRKIYSECKIQLLLTDVVEEQAVLKTKINNALENMTSTNSKIRLFLENGKSYGNNANQKIIINKEIKVDGNV